MFPFISAINLAFFFETDFKVFKKVSGALLKICRPKQYFSRRTCCSGGAGQHTERPLAEDLLLDGESGGSASAVAAPGGGNVGEEKSVSAATPKNGSERPAATGTPTFTTPGAAPSAGSGTGNEAKKPLPAATPFRPKQQALRKTPNRGIRNASVLASGSSRGSSVKKTPGSGGNARGPARSRESRTRVQIPNLAAASQHPAGTGISAASTVLAGVGILMRSCLRGGGRGGARGGCRGVPQPAQEGEERKSVRFAPVVEERVTIEENADRVAQKASTTKRRLSDLEAAAADREAFLCAAAREELGRRQNVANPAAGTTPRASVAAAAAASGFHFGGSGGSGSGATGGPPRKKRRLERKPTPPAGMGFMGAHAVGLVSAREARETPFCPSQEKFHTAGLWGLRNISEAP